MLRIQLDGPAVTLDDVTHDGQAEASTSGDGLAGLVDAVEALEDLGAPVGGHAAAVVVDAQRHETAGFGQPHVHR